MYSYAYQWLVTCLAPNPDEERVVRVQSGNFEIKEGFAASLAKPFPEEVFPLATNTGGNHFVGDLTTDATLCVGCADGDSADVGPYFPAMIRSKGFAPGIILDEDGPDELWRIDSVNGAFGLADLATGTETISTLPITVGDHAPDYSLSVASSGNVGLGTYPALAPLHLMRVDGTTQLLVEEGNGSIAVRTLLQLENNGAPRFALKNTGSGIEWSFQQSGPGNFLISKEGTGGPELQVYQNGRVRMGPAGAINFDLDPNGNLKINRWGFGGYTRL